MKGNNIFNTWIREFCSLVLIQTIQAFIFAIIMVLIISVMTPENSSGIDRGDLVASTGMIAVIALASISKIEELVKKIFKIQPGVTDPSMRGGLKSLATTMMAAKLAGRVGDNFKKIGGGIAGVYGASKAMTQQKSRFARDMKRYGQGGAVPADGAAGGAPLPESPQPAPVPQPASPTAPSTPGAPGAPGTSGTATQNAGMDQKALDDYYRKLDDYQDKMAELRKKRRDAVFSGISGLTETAGAISVGTMGAVGGIAIGEGKEAVQAGLVGMGVGDFLGGAAVKPVKGLADVATEVKDYQVTKERFVRDVASTSKEAKDAIEKRRIQLTKYNEAKRQYQDFERDIFDVGDID